jgi:hypothetical protein
MDSCYSTCYSGYMGYGGYTGYCGYTGGCFGHKRGGGLFGCFKRNRCASAACSPCGVWGGGISAGIYDSGYGAWGAPVPPVFGSYTPAYATTAPAPASVTTPMTNPAPVPSTTTPPADVVEPVTPANPPVPAPDTGLDEDTPPANPVPAVPAVPTAPTPGI